VLGFEASGAALALAASEGNLDRPDRPRPVAQPGCGIEEITGTAAGTHKLAVALTDRLGPDYLEALGALADALASDQDEIAAAAEIGRARALANCMNFPGADSLLILLEEQVRRIDSGELTGSPPLREATQEILAELIRVRSCPRAGCGRSACPVRAPPNPAKMSAPARSTRCPGAGGARSRPGRPGARNPAISARRRRVAAGFRRHLAARAGDADRASDRQRQARVRNLDRS
jgi:hypothetical protein